MYVVIGEPGSSSGEGKYVQVGKRIAAVGKNVDDVWCLCGATVRWEENAWCSAVGFELCHQLRNGDSV